MSDKELDALAQLLRAIYCEARGIGTKPLSDYASDNEAWIQVAEFVASRDSDLRNHLTEVVNNREWPDHR